MSKVRIYHQIPYPMFIIRLKENKNPGPFRKFQRPQKVTANEVNSELSLTFGYMNVNGFDHQSSWAIDRILKGEVISFSVHYIFV